MQGISGLTSQWPSGAHAAARAVAQILGAGHGAGHARAVQDTLPAHAAVKDGPFAHFFHPDNQRLLTVGIGPRWLSASRVDYYYGVREEEARPERPAYRGQDTWNLDVNVTAILNVTSKLSLFVLLNREQLGSGIENSPLVERSSAYSLVTSFTYGF